MLHPCRSDWRKLCVDGFRRRRSDREFDFADLVLTALLTPTPSRPTPHEPLLYSANIVCGFWGDPTCALPLSKGPTPTHPRSLRTYFERKNYPRVPQRSAPTPCWERPSVLSYATTTPKLNTASTYISATYQTLDLSLFNMNVVIADYLAPALDFAMR